MLAQERLTIHIHEALCSQETRPHRHNKHVRAFTRGGWSSNATRGSGSPAAMARGVIAGTGSCDKACRSHLCANEPDLLMVMSRAVPTTASLVCHRAGGSCCMSFAPVSWVHRSD